MPDERIALGYNVVDNALYAARAEAARRSAQGRKGLPVAPYFLAVCRFAPEKNEGGRRYYVMSDLLRSVVSELLVPMKKAP